MSDEVFETKLYDEETEYEPGMPKVDDDGRKIVKVAASNENGWRYMHEDAMTEEDQLLPEPKSGWEAPVAKAKK